MLCATHLVILWVLTSASAAKTVVSSALELLGCLYIMGTLLVVVGYWNTSDPDTSPKAMLVMLTVTWNADCTAFG